MPDRSSHWSARIVYIRPETSGRNLRIAQEVREGQGRRDYPPLHRQNRVTAYQRDCSAFPDGIERPVIFRESIHNDLMAANNVQPLNDLSVLAGGIPPDEDVDEMLRVIYDARKWVIIATVDATSMVEVLLV